MDVESLVHLERLRDQPDVKAALLVLQVVEPDRSVRFERAAKNTEYWAPIQSVLQRFSAQGAIEEFREPVTIYGRPCTLIATARAPRDSAPFAIAVVASDGEPIEKIAALLRDVCYNYWYGSSFFK